MNTFKKVTAGVLVAGIAFGVSAFTTLKKQYVYNYYKTDLTYPKPKDPRGYRYYAGDRCEAGGDICCAYWNIGFNVPPSADGDPLPMTGVHYQLGTELVGHFE